MAAFLEMPKAVVADIPAFGGHLVGCQAASVGHWANSVLVEQG